ncbi:MAG TPA: hypothetical protein VJS64_19305 [Pyrinomonadaceae bacterium]|nr:hypothetical protein [Pyrinomonadaceae bacterium]
MMQFLTAGISDEPAPKNLMRVPARFALQDLAASSSDFLEAFSGLRLGDEIDSDRDFEGLQSLPAVLLIGRGPNLRVQANLHNFSQRTVFRIITIA